jgi:(2R)-3-sulfolactate dehydrogenase (NADP+)
MTHETVAITEVERLSCLALVRAGTSPENARSVAASVALAELQGISSHGLLRLGTYCDHAASGKVDGKAKPELSKPRPGLVVADAKTGFAHPAIDLGVPVLVEAARANGTALLCVTNSYNCGIVGDHVARIAREGLVALGFVNAPASIAPWGGHKALFGTNPVAFATPRAGGEPLVLDQSSSVVARGEIMLRAKSGEPIPEGWALDSHGNPTRDAAVALKGSLLPAGGHNGSGQALMVEILAAALTGAHFGFEASSFATPDGGPPRTGQAFFAIDPAAFGPGFGERVAALIARMMEQPGVRLPGAKRASAAATARTHGIRLTAANLADLRQRAGE